MTRLARLLCYWAGHDWRRTTLTWFEADDPTAPTWRHRRHPGPMTCARCDTLAPGGHVVAIPVAPGWTGVVLIDSVRLHLEVKR